MEKKMTALEKAIKDLRRINTASTLDTADILERDYLPLERKQIEEAIVVCLEEYGCNIPLPEDAQKEIASDYFTQTYGKG